MVWYPLLNIHGIDMELHTRIWKEARISHSNHQTILVNNFCIQKEYTIPVTADEKAQAFFDLSVEYVGCTFDPFCDPEEKMRLYLNWRHAGQELREAAEELTDKQNVSSTITQAFTPSPKTT
jgi:thiol:disulfide interchange protein